MNTWQLNNLKCLQLELTSYCQASCPGCARPYDYSKHIHNHKVARSWTLENFKTLIPKSLIENINELFICGNYGDPLLCEELEEILSHALEINPDIFICIHTNGGAGSKEKWIGLAHLLHNKKHSVKFSIDGLEDTNSFYRRGVSWKKISENAKAFITNGGRATWKYIQFPHNEHQIERARELSRKSGFKKFELRKAHEYDLNIANIPNANELSPLTQKSFKEVPDKELLDNLNSLKTHKEISCVSLNDGYLYLDADLNVWPCCWISQEGDYRTRLKARELFFRRVYDQGIEKDFNNLLKYNINEILESDFFKKRLPESWTSKGFKCDKALNACYEFCSKN